MNCPVCGQPLNVEWNDPQKKCTVCGWGGRSRTLKTAREESSSPVVTVFMLVIMWVLSIGIVIGSFWLADRWHGARLNVTHPNWRWMFAGIWALYVALCYSFENPEFEKDDWFWIIIGKPFSFDDEIARFKFVILILMLPGKIVSRTLAGTFAFFRS